MTWLKVKAKKEILKTRQKRKEKLVNSKNAFGTGKQKETRKKSHFCIKKIRFTSDINRKKDNLRRDIPAISW